MSTSDEQSDGAIVAAVLDGQRDRFVVLASRYQRPLFRLAYDRLGHVEWAEDVVQEAFLCAFKSLHSYDSKYSFRTWLWTILLNQCRRQWGKQARRTNLAGESAAGLDESNLEEDVSADAPPLEAMIASERHQQLRQLLECLPENQADALRLRFYGELKFQEIADVMSCSLSSAKNRVRWGLSALSEKLSAGGSSSAVRQRENQK